MPDLNHGPLAPDIFKIRLRLMNTEVLDFSLESSSPRKAWALFILMFMVVSAILASAIGPLVVDLAQ